jgi:hypothetical protein
MSSVRPSRAPKAARDSGRARHADLLQVEHPVEQRDVGEGGASGADVTEHPRARPGEMARPDRGHSARAPLRDRGGVDDRPRRPGARVVQREQRQLGGQAPLPVLDVVADDLDRRNTERGHVRAEDVEVPAEGRIGHDVLARLEHHLARALGGERSLDGGESDVGPHPEALDVRPGQEADLELGHGQRGARPAQGTSATAASGDVTREAKLPSR